jgi:raffinose/stachyose/melibiose transport system substrate-binding protein
MSDGLGPIGGPLSRRQLLRGAAGMAGLVALGPLAACGGDDGEKSGSAAKSAGEMAKRGDELKLWWWGEQEAVGITKWLDDVRAKFEQQTGVKIKATLMDTDNVVPQFTNAAAAGRPPDLQFLFNGIYHMENAWLGYLKPLNGLVADDVLARSGATKMSSFEGKQYRVGYYGLGMGLSYNKQHFENAKLDPETPPKTWDEFIEACAKLEEKGHIPIGGGVKDGFLGEWYMVHGLTQNLDSPQDALQLFIGDLDWREPRYHEMWTKLAELKSKGYFNDDVTSKELYQGIQLYDTGKASMCFNTTPSLPNSQKQLGADTVGFMKLPTFGTGALADKYIRDTQGFGIPAKGNFDGSAAKFLEFMHAPEQVQSMWALSKQIPADDQFDSSVIDEPLLKTTYDNWFKGDNTDYIADLMPTKFWTDAMFVNSQKILAGGFSGEQAANLAHDITETWKKQNPDMVANYQTWSKDLA